MPVWVRTSAAVLEDMAVEIAAPRNYISIEVILRALLPLHAITPRVSTATCPPADCVPKFLLHLDAYPDFSPDSVSQRRALRQRLHKQHPPPRMFILTW